VSDRKNHKGEMSYNSSNCRSDVTAACSLSQRRLRNKITRGELVGLQVKLTFIRVLLGAVLKPSNSSLL